jgi:hypothetical protein
MSLIEMLGEADLELKSITYLLIKRTPQIGRQTNTCPAVESTLFCYVPLRGADSLMLKLL